MRTRLALASAVAVAAALAAAGPAGSRPAESSPDEPSTLVYPPFGHCLGMHRATTLHLFLYLGTRTQFDEPAGLAAVKLDVNDDPETHEDDDELTVFGLNSGACEIIFNTSLYNVEIYGECGSGPGQFRKPLGIAADSRGNVFVADTGNHRVVRLLYESGALRYIKSFGSEGPDEGQFRSPSQIALGESGNLYVTDTGNDRVVVMSSVGEVISTLTGDAESGVQLDGPIGIAVAEKGDPWLSTNRDGIVVADRGGERLLKLSMDGRLVGVLDADDVPVPGATFGYLAIDFYGSVYATDRVNSRIHKFDSGLTHVTSFGRHGTGDMELDEPRGITLWRRFGQIFVTERAGAQYFWIGTDILDATVEPSAIAPGEDEARISYFLTEVARVDLELIDASGDVVHTLVNGRRRAIGGNIERWRGTFGGRRGPVPPGEYTLRLTATPTYSSGDYFHDTAEMALEILPKPAP